MRLDHEPVSQLLFRVFVSQSDSGGHHEHFFLPKTLAVPDTCAAPPLVGTEKASYAARADQRRVCSTQRVPRIRLCESRLKQRRLDSQGMPGAIASGILGFGRRIESNL